MLGKKIELTALREIKTVINVNIAPEKSKNGKHMFSIMSLLIILVSSSVVAITNIDYCDVPNDSDVIVLFIGPDYQERRREALQLLEEGYANILFIPALNKLLTSIDGKIKESPYNEICFDRKIYPDYYENTHVEILETKKMMERERYTSAIFVSAPYHMKRISIIAKRVFCNKEYQLNFRGRSYVQHKESLLLLSWCKVKHFFEEYCKIVGFYVSSL